MKHKIHVRGYILILIAALLFGTYGVWSRLMGDTFAPFYQAWVRSIIIIFIMLPFMIANKSFRKIQRADWPALGIFISFCIFTQAPLYFAFNNAPIGTVQLLFYSTFVITAFFVSRFYLGETISKIKIISIILAFLGLALLFSDAVLVFAPLGLGLAMLNGVASGGEVSSSKKIESKYSPALIVFWGWVFTILTHLPISLLIGEEQNAIQFNRAWMWLLIYSFVNAAAFWLVIEGFRHVDASIGSLIGLLEVVFGVLFGALFFKEALTWSVCVGGALIISAAMLPDVHSLLHRKKNKQPI